MPIYEYICPKCGKVMEIKESLAEKEKGSEHNCPACSSKMNQYFGNMTVFASSHLH